MKQLLLAMFIAAAFSHASEMFSQYHDCTSVRAWGHMTMDWAKYMELDPTGESLQYYWGSNFLREGSYVQYNSRLDLTALVRLFVPMEESDPLVETLTIEVLRLPTIGERAVSGVVDTVGIQTVLIHEMKLLRQQGVLVASDEWFDRVIAAMQIYTNRYGIHYAYERDDGTANDIVPSVCEPSNKVKESNVLPNAPGLWPRSLDASSAWEAGLYRIGSSLLYLNSAQRFDLRGRRLY